MTPSPPELIEQAIETRHEENLRQGQTAKLLELIALYPSRPKVSARIGTRMTPKLREQMKQLLIVRRDVFA